MLYLIVPLVMTFVLGASQWADHGWRPQTVGVICDSLLVSGATSFILWLAY